MFLFVFACKSASDQWWQNEDANPYTFDQTSGEGEEGGGEDEVGFFGVLHSVDDGYTGECGVEMVGCTWYGIITGEETEACPDCTFAVTVSTGDVTVFDDDGCPDGFSPDDFSNINFVMGFQDESSWLYEDGEWVEVGFYLQEEDYHIWFIPFE